MKKIIKVAIFSAIGIVILSLFGRKKQEVKSLPNKACWRPWRHKDTGKFVSSEFAWNYPWMVK